MSLQTRVHRKVSRLGEAIIFLFCFFVYLFFVMIFCWQFFFVVTSAFLSTGPNATIASSLGERNAGLRPELELHLKALASSIAKPKRNALHSAVLLHGTMAGFVQYCQKTKYLLICNILVLEIKTFGLVLEFKMWCCGINRTLT